MKRRRIILVGIGLIAAVVVDALVWSGEREPEYQGKKLTEWLRIYSQAQSSSENQAAVERRRRECCEAVRQIGTNSLPWLLGWINAEYSPSKERVRRIYSKLPGAIQNNAALRKLTVQGASDQEGHGYAGLSILGHEARAAVPQLVRQMQDTNSSLQLRQCAMACLAYMGDEGLPSLTQALTDTSQPDRMYVAFYIGCMHEFFKDARLAVPALVQSLADPDKNVAEQAALSLGKLRIEPDLAVPGLTNSLRNERARVRTVSASALGEFGPAAHSALPALLATINDPDLHVRRAAMNAVREIAPEMLRTNSVPPDAKP